MLGTSGSEIVSGGMDAEYGDAQSAVINIATKEIPLPTALGDSCLTVNGVAVPMLFVSPTQINVQVPWELQGQTSAQVAHFPG